MLKKYLKNERGLTLVELLAVLVIIGIVAAIAIPSIGNIIDNARRDAHVANAKMMADAARQWLAANPNQTFTSNSTSVTLETLNQQGFINIPQFPGGGGFAYSPTNCQVTITRAAVGTQGNFNYTYTVLLERDGSNTDILNFNAETATRANVTLP
ncbi:prepilin-type N-terminal cleavage/methylation domain-containing protein [Brevibacillus sp. SYSU BS000544]|uniref:prepilin-type N-terminal cleavage/methylation domain-containing protein n=1 Tax=Brevibacillus sp. SYSU BS000544 TaxID=3416443 RepID=UPI003CE4CECE